MRLTFHGAAGEVTGSCYLLETAQARVLIDFGLHQGAMDAAKKNGRFPPIAPESLNAVVLTHAHLDHVGRLPLLVGGCCRRPDGGGRTQPAPFRAPVYATAASIDLAAIILKDAAHIQDADAERENRRRLREGKTPVAPLYTSADADRAIALLRAVRFGEGREIAPGVTCRFFESGHILGAASVELTVCENGAAPKIVVFSGDIGPRGVPLLRDPEPPPRADVLVLESTYGNRDHRARSATVAELNQVLNEARDPGGAGGGKVLIPCFAVGRTQELIYELGCLRRDEARSRRVRDTELPGVYVDSPLGIEATGLYARHPELFDGEAAAILRSGGSPLNFPGLRFTRTREQSAALNSMGGGAIVMAGSGMCTGGRILHHLRHGLPNPRNHVVFVGFQAEGTLGRRLVNRESVVRVMGEMVSVRAAVHTLGGFSAHAGRTELLAWASRVRPVGGTMRLFLTHGEDMPRRSLAAALRDQSGWTATLPGFGDSVEL